MNNKMRFIIVQIFAIIFLWIGIVATDYVLSKNARAPLFAININASDADVYRGAGYTIIIDDGYAVAPSDAELKGYFYWGWR